jgi:hypothetical protein
VQGVVNKVGLRVVLVRSGIAKTLRRVLADERTGKTDLGLL